MTKTVAYSIASFFAAFFIVACLIRVVLPSPLGLYAAMRSEKLLLMDQWNGRANSAVFGSSHVHNGFDPRTFDSTLAGTPLRTTTINLGIEGGSQSEQRVMALKFVSGLRPHPDQACFVLLELNAGANFTPDHLVHPRTIDIYDWKTVRLLRELSPLSLGRSRAAGRFAIALVGASMYYTNVGMLSNLIFAPPLDQQMIVDQTRDDRRGLLSPTAPPGITATIEKLVDAESHAMVPAPETLLPGNYELADEIMKASPVHNLRVIYWMSPRLDNLVSYPVYPPEITVDGVITPILSMARPDLYPDLYVPSNWADGTHLNATGAAMLGHDLAAQLLDWHRAHPQSQPMSCGG